MSTMTLKMPKTYVDVESDEMEYVDGGWYVDKTWFGANVYLTHKERVTLTSGQVIAGLAATGFGAVVVAAATALIWNYDDGYGVRLRFTGLVPPYSLTGIFALTKSEEKNLAAKNTISL